MLLNNKLRRKVLITPLLLISIGYSTQLSASDPESLKSVPVPEPDNLSDFVKNKGAAINLGKALFWDMQVGSDGTVACASCHFNAGVDNRTVNTVNPGKNGVFDLPGITDTNSQVTASLFPFGGDPAIDDIVGSQGISKQTFNAINTGSAIDDCTAENDPVFHSDRQVTDRNVPSVIMAAYYEFNNWAGNANTVFDGVSVTNQGGSIFFSENGQLVARNVAISPSSQSSQAVGPPLNDVEMSCAGRTFPLLGRKLLSLTPLAQQLVAANDSRLGPLSNHPALGLNTNYTSLIQQAFVDELWNNAGLTPAGFTQLEANFSLFFGLSIGLYEATLIPDDTPFDRFAEGDNSALTRRQKRGFDLFEGKARCDGCHGGTEFTSAALTNGSNGKAFTNTGVRPIAEDEGRGDGEFKSQTLRNIELTGPYFHNGGYATLMQVIDFYDRGGDFPNDETDSDVRELDLSNSEKTALVDFMLSLTDERVRFEKAPFDHPSLILPNGDNLPAVGADGGNAIGTFLGLDPFSR